MNKLNMGTVAKLLQNWAKSSELLGSDENIRDDLQALSKLLGKRAFKDMTVDQFEAALVSPRPQKGTGSKGKSTKASEADISEAARELRSFYESIPDGNISHDEIEKRINALGKRFTVPALKQLVDTLDLPVRKRTKSEMVEDIKRWLTDRNQNVLKKKHGWF